MPEFRRIIIPGNVNTDPIEYTFATGYKRIIVEFPKQFTNAAWGFGRLYGRKYGRN